jgi:hypothetical protein
MHSRYTADGYTFDSKDSYNSYLVDSDPENCTGWGGPNPENYGGYKEEESSSRYEQDTSFYHSSYYQRSPKDPKYYHGPREEFDIEHETEKAYLLTNGVAKFWCPKALIIDVLRVRNSISGRLWKGLTRQIIT